MLFITGINSFVGKKLEEKCIRNKIKYIGIDKVCNNSKNNKKVDLIKDNLDKYIPKNSVVIHLAAISTDKSCRDDVELSLNTNILGTQRLLDACKRKKIKQFIFASTEWVYGDIPKKTILQKESDLIDIKKNNSQYAVTKFVGEKLCDYMRSFFTITILRFGIIYSSRLKNWTAVESLFYQAAKKKQIQVGSIKTSRRFIHIDDIIDGILYSIGRQNNEIFNLTGDKLIDLKQLIIACSKILNKKIKILEKNKKNFSIRNPINHNAKKYLRWSQKIKLEDGLKDLHSFFKKNKII
jgi:nucleoside-diphosphate-sugar epimerase